MPLLGRLKYGKCRWLLRPLIRQLTRIRGAVLLAADSPPWLTLNRKATALALARGMLNSMSFEMALAAQPVTPVPDRLSLEQCRPQLMSTLLLAKQGPKQPKLNRCRNEPPRSVMLMSPLALRKPCRRMERSAIRFRSLD